MRRERWPAAAVSAGLATLWLAASVAITWWDWQDRWNAPGHETKYFFRLWLFWVSLAGPVLLAGSLYLCVRCRSLAGRITWCLMGLLLAIGCWARLVEPNLLRVRTTTLTGIPAHSTPLRLALVADIHWGLFGRDGQLQRLVDRLNALEVDAIVVAGDWTYEPKRDLVGGLAPLSQLRAPVFGVLGNHDLRAPGPDVEQTLRHALQTHRVQLLEGKRLAWRGWELVGIDDLWGGHPEAQIATLLTTPSPSRLIVSHQPDAVARFPRNAAFLTLSGHTHGGQITLPYLKRHVLESGTLNPWWDGLYSTESSRLFVTPGIGMISLPARLGVPPTIDVLELTH